jgi:hypothetical protein
MSISFNCLFLVFIIYHYLVYFLRKENKSNLFTFLLFSCVVCACVSQRDLCRKKTRKKGDGIPCTFDFLSCCCVPNCVFCFFYAATITAAAAVFLYLFIKRLCVCVCQLLLSAVCLRACEQFTHFILLFSVFSFRLLKKLPNLFTT